MFYGAHLYVFAVSKTIYCGINQHITEKYPIKWKRIQYSVFSFFRSCYHPLYR